MVTTEVTTTHRAVRIWPDGIPEEVRFASLEDLQGYVDGLIEPVYLDRAGTVIGWVNEEGKLLGLPVNEAATGIARRAHAIAPLDVIVGSMVVAGADPGTGEDADLPQTWVDHLMH